LARGREWQAEIVPLHALVEESVTAVELGEGVECKLEVGDAVWTVPRTEAKLVLLRATSR